MSDLLAIIIASVIILTPAMGVGYLFEKAACDNKAQSFEKHEFYFIGGCMVYHNDKWLPLENIRGFDDK